MFGGHGRLKSEPRETLDTRRKDPAGLSGGWTQKSESDRKKRRGTHCDATVRTSPGNRDIGSYLLYLPPEVLDHIASLQA